MYMVNKIVQEEIAEFRNNRKSFTIIDKNWLWKTEVMIVWIKHHINKDDVVKVIDMWDFEESFDILDYEITLTALIEARNNYLLSLV